MPTQAQPSPAQPSPAQAAALAAVARSTKLTGRAALLAVVICAIALSLAYPVREYIAQRQQIDQLLAQQQTMSAEVQALQAENGVSPNVVSAERNGDPGRILRLQQCLRRPSRRRASASVSKLCA